MNRTMITTGSVTYAIKARDLLRKHGYRVQIKRITSGLGNVGCGYTVIFEGNSEKAESLLRSAGIKILGVNRA